MNFWSNSAALPAFADPYLDWHRADGGAYAVDQKEAAIYGEVIAEDVVCLLAEFSREPTADERVVIEMMANIGMIAESSRFASLRVDKKNLQDLLSTFPAPLLRVELSMPIAQASNKGVLQTATSTPEVADVLVGIIDDACPFVHAKWRGRVRALWVQGHGGKPAKLDNVPVGLAHPQYGWAYLKEDSKGQLGQNAVKTGNQSRGLDAWQDAHTNQPTGVVDEEGSYADLGQRVLRHRTSHGAHVLDLFAGRVAPSARAAPLGDNLPTWALDTGAAASAPIAFVQLPRYAVEDTSGRWLGTYVLDGLSYILAQAKSLKVKRVVVNTSYGHTTGPHDGSSIAEQAMDELCTAYSDPRKLKLSIVLSSGNGFKSQTAAKVKLSQCGTAAALASFCWRVVPDGTRPGFMEIWFPDGTGESDVAITIKPPTESVSYLVQPGVNTWQANATTGPVVAWSVFKQTIGALGKAKKLSAVIALAPTDLAIRTTASAPSGDWIISVENKTINDMSIYAYIARATPHMHSPRTGTLSCFVDPAYDPDRFLKEQTDDVSASAAKVRRRGTLNGMASGNQTVVAAGYRLLDKKHSRHAAAGPTRDGRVGVSLSYPSDVSDALRGIRAAGNRSGATFRMEGTSVAAPQASRDLANQTGSSTSPVPSGDAQLLGKTENAQP